MRNRFSQIATVALVVLIVIVVLGPLVLPWDHETIDWNSIDQSPSWSHWFGTDGSGRDLLARTLIGGRVSLAIAILATLVSFCIGLPWGAIAGYFGGRLDHVMMRFVDGLYSIPFVLVVILLVVLFGRNIYLLFIGLGAVSWLDIARITRGQTLAVRNEQYVLSARALGLHESEIVRRHVIPNVIHPALVYASLTIPGVIIAESFISFLGLGVQEPMASWGVLIADGTKNIHTSPWQMLFPACLLAMTLLLVNVVGEHIRESIMEGSDVR